MNYGQIQTDFMALLNRRDCTTAQRDGFLSEGIARIQRELRCPANEKYVTVTVASDYAGLTIPADFIELISIFPQGSEDRLEKDDISNVRNLATVVGTPEKYCRKGGVWILGPTPAAATTIEIGYYAELETLSASDDETVITRIAPDLIKYAALSYAGDHFRDKRTADWETRYTQILKSLHDMADADELSGASTVSSAYDFQDDCD